MIGHNMQQELDVAATAIRAALTRCERGNADWRGGSFDTVVEMAKARACFLGDKEFGKWLADAGIEMSHQDRAAAIAMGKDPERALQVLSATQRRSLQHIYAQEFRFTHVSKAPKAPPAKQPVSVEKRERAFAAYDRRKEAGEPITYAALQEEAEVSSTVVRVVLAARQSQEEEAAAAADIPSEVERLKAELAAEKRRQESLRELHDDTLARVAKMTAAERKKWDKQVENAKYDIQRMIAQEAGRKLVKWKEETGIALFEKRLEKIEQMFTAWPHSIMRKTEYNAIMRCLHPDTAHSRTEEQRAEAFRLFTYYKMKMLNDEEERITARRELRSQMPKTLQEMDARRKTKAGPAA